MNTANKTSVPVPPTREAAIDALVNMDVAKWGENEREASRRLHNGNLPTYGLALNSLAHRAEYDYGDLVPELVAAAKKVLTPDDWSELRKGG